MYRYTQDQPFAQQDYDDDMDIPEEDSVSNSSELKRIYNSTLNDNVLISNKGKIKATERERFLSGLEEAHLSSPNLPSLLKLMPCKPTPVTRYS